MLVRKCAKGHEVQLYKNTTPSATRTQTYQDGTVVTLSYPSAAKDYFVMTDGDIVKRSDSFVTAETSFVSECAKKHPDGNGRIDFVKHKLVDRKVVSK